MVVGASPNDLFLRLFERNSIRWAAEAPLGTAGKGGNRPNARLVAMLTLGFHFESRLSLTAGLGSPCRPTVMSAMRFGVLAQSLLASLGLVAVTMLGFIRRSPSNACGDEGIRIQVSIDTCLGKRRRSSVPPTRRDYENFARVSLKSTM